MEHRSKPAKTNTYDTFLISRVVPRYVLGHVRSTMTCPSQRQVMCATFSEDGGLASGCSDGHLRFWKDTEQVVGLGEETSTTLTCRAAVKSVSFIPL